MEETDRRLILKGEGNDRDPSSTDDWLAVNQSAWNELAASGHVLAQPAEDHLFADPLRCVDRPGWLGDSIRGWRVLCLASGGGRQGPLYAAAGAQVTVVDISSAMLQLDRQVAAERKLDVQTVLTPMDRLSMFGDGTFDLVIHPVSTCYIPDVRGVYAEVARVLRDGGLYVSQHKQPTNLQASLKPSADGYAIDERYYRTGPLRPFQGKSPFRETGATEFLHRWEELVGWMCRAGFVIEDLIEPFHAKRDAAAGSMGHRSLYVPPYVRIKARRRPRGNMGSR